MWDLYCLVYDVKSLFIGTRSKTSSVSTVDGHDGPSSSPTLLINGHVRREMPAPRSSTKKSEIVVQHQGV